MSLGPGLSCGMDQNEGKDEPVHALDYVGSMPPSNDNISDSNAQYVDFLNAKGASNTNGIFTLDPEHRVLQSYSFPEISGVSEPCKPSHSLRGPDDGGVPPKIRDPQAKEE